MDDDPHFDEILRRHRANTCHRCGRKFSTPQGLGLHFSHLRKAFGQMRAERICPDLRGAEERRAADMQRIRLKTKLGLLGKHP